MQKNVAPAPFGRLDCQPYYKLYQCWAAKDLWDPCCKCEAEAMCTSTVVSITTE